MAFGGRTPIPTSAPAILFLCLSLLLPLRSPLAENGGCQLRPDRQHANDQVLVCGKALTIHSAPGTVYRPADASRDAAPASVQLDNGALLLDFHANVPHRDFQILTPLAIASVRGTRWAVEATPDRTSVLVLRGVVSVARPGGEFVLLERGEGVDVLPDSAPLQSKEWSPERVKALLQRFGQ
jgi:FecR protein